MTVGQKSGIDRRRKSQWSEINIFLLSCEISRNDVRFRRYNNTMIVDDDVDLCIWNGRIELLLTSPEREWESETQKHVSIICLCSLHIAMAWHVSAICCSVGCGRESGDDEFAYAMIRNEAPTTLTCWEYIYEMEKRCKDIVPRTPCQIAQHKSHLLVHFIQTLNATGCRCKQSEWQRQHKILFRFRLFLLFTHFVWLCLISLCRVYDVAVQEKLKSLAFATMCVCVCLWCDA